MSTAGALAALCGGVAAFVVADGAALLAHVWARRSAAQARESSAAASPRRWSQRWVARVVVSARRPGGAVQELLARHGVRTPPDLGARLAAAGVSRAGAAEQVMALKCAVAAGAALVVAPTALSASSGAALALLAVAPTAAFLVPDWLIARRARLRARRLRVQAPELLERLRLGSEAGLGPERALALAAARDEGLLATELRATLAAIELGLSREQALRALCARCPVPEVRALAAALRRSALHGAPLAAAAGSLAAASRAERARRIQESAQRAAPKIQLVVALLLVPAAMLLVAAAMLAGLR